MTDSDRAIEHLLRNGAATPSGDPSARCLDADTLAAWVDGRLTRTELAAAEAHAAGCARCQAMLAVMARTAASVEDAAELVVPRRSLWRMLPWMGPLAAAATAAAIYVAVRPGVDLVNERAERSRATQTASTPAPAQEATQSRAELEPATPTPPASAPPATSPARSARDAEQDQRNRAKQTAADAPAERRNADSSTKPTAKDVAVAEKPAASADRQSKEAATRALSVPAPQIPAVVSERPAPAAAPPPPPAKIAEEAKRREGFAAGAAAAAPAGSRADALLDRVATPLVIQSPDLDIRWRVVGGNVVQRSTDRGRTWSTQATGTTKAIAAGFSPSATACWLVGAGGLVAVTTDGATWTAVPFPHAIDLTNVQASSADAAVVFAADGRTFTTADRGKSWK